MWFSRSIIISTLALVSFSAGSHTPEDQTHGRHGGFRFRLEDLVSRIEALEQAAASQSVEGRTYCMLVNLTVFRSVSSISQASAETLVVRRALHFAGGAFTATLVDSGGNSQRDDGIVSQIAIASPSVLTGTYIQSGTQLNLQFADTSTVTWYVSRDGSVIASSSSDFVGPFPAGLTIGIVRNATSVESDTCEAN